MKSFKKILLLFAIAVGLLFLVSQYQPGKYAIVSENPTPEYAQEGMHATAFLQPETTRHVVSTVKSFAFSAVRWSVFFETDFANILTSKLKKNLLSQDINRCERVSLLLFPHHYFW